MDVTPSNFSDSSETELMRTALGKLRDSGKNVYIVSQAEQALGTLLRTE